MSDHGFTAQAWICPLCFDDHGGRDCDPEDLKAELRDSRARIAEVEAERDRAQEHMAYHLHDFRPMADMAATGDLAVDMAAFAERMESRAEAAEQKVTALEAERPALWECPDCAFGFDAQHTDQNGGYSCPACAEHELGKQVAALAEVIEALRDRHYDEGPGEWSGRPHVCGGCGRDWPCADRRSIDTALAAAPTPPQSPDPWQAVRALADEWEQRAVTAVEDGLGLRRQHWANWSFVEELRAIIPAAPTPPAEAEAWSTEDRRDVAAWLIREADDRVHLFPQRRDGVDALLRHLAKTTRPAEGVSSEGPRSVQWAGLNGVPGQIQRLLAVDGQTFGYAPSEGWSVTFGYLCRGERVEIVVQPGQWVTRYPDDTVTVTDERPTPPAEAECVPGNGCTCLGHRVPGVSHMVPCCDEPHASGSPTPPTTDAEEAGRG